MAVKTFVSTGYKPDGSIYFNPYSPDVFTAGDQYYIIKIDTDGEPYYTRL